MITGELEYYRPIPYPYDWNAAELALTSKNKNIKVLEGPIETDRMRKIICF